jgi:D-lyxose ketol-isomerase
VDESNIRREEGQAPVKRSAINAILAEADRFIRSFGVVLPPFADWSPEAFRSRRAELDALIDARLGWDVTDYGQGLFDELGLVLFTLRNGCIGDLATGGGRVYAEKLLISREGQISPMHHHLRKTEDIINRGGATLALELYRVAPGGGFDRARPVEVMCDALPRRVAPGETLRLEPGESVTLTPDIWHAFRGEGGDVLIGEVSTVNDDETDNVFADAYPRFARIEEDEPPLRLLVSDYQRL